MTPAASACRKAASRRPDRRCWSSVVPHEAARVRLLTAEAAEVLLEGCERAVEVDGENGDRVEDGRDVEEQQPGPTPGQNRAGGDEQDEAEVDDDHEIGQPAVQHYG